MLQEKDVIFEIFQYATERAKVVGAENIYDFSLGNPSVPAPSIVNETIVQKVNTLDPLALHGYSPSFGIMETREKIAASLNKKYGSAYKAANIFMAIGAAGALAHALRAVTNPGDEIIELSAGIQRHQRAFGATLPAVLPAAGTNLAPRGLFVIAAPRTTPFPEFPA